LRFCGVSGRATGPLERLQPTGPGYPSGRPGLYTAVGRAGSPSKLARPSFFVLEALRRIAGGATMFSPDGESTPRIAPSQPPRARRTGFHQRVGAPTLRGSGPYAILEAVPTQQAEEVERCLVEPLAG